jgi:hypothetical protein
MDPVSVRYVRAALLWLVPGFVLGGLMLADELAPGTWRVWFAPTHGHMLFVGWFFQFAIGVAYWLLPRRRLPGRPRGYDERVATAGIVTLNAGLLLRSIAEPAGRMGHSGPLFDWVLALAALLQLAAALIVVAQLWGRVTARQRRTETR